MGKIKKTVAIILSLILILSMAGSAFAANTMDSSTKPSQVGIYIKPDIQVTYDDDILQFKDEKGNVVFPINFMGSTYLPVRAISGLMRQDIQWIGSSQMILIGSTLTNIDGKIEGESPYVTVVDSRSSGVQVLDSAWLKPEIRILFNFEEQIFKDANGQIVYPIIYAGSTYLPLRSIAKLMGCDISWDDESKTVAINSKADEMVEESRTVKAIKELYEDSYDIYASATKTIANLANKEDDELAEIAADITAYYKDAQANTNKAKRIKDKYAFTEDEADAFEKVATFTAAIEAYMLVVENIAYMAAQNQDYSILSNSFFEAAVLAQEYMEEASAAIDNL